MIPVTAVGWVERKRYPTWVGAVGFLRDRLKELKSEKLISKVKQRLMYKEVLTDQGRVVCVSTAPTLTLEKELEWLKFRSVSPRI